MTTESAKAAKAKYDARTARYISLKLNLKTDADILEHLGKVENIQGYIKAIVRNEMEGVKPMKHFERKTEQLYGAKNAGYTIDKSAERETDTQLIRKLIAARGERFVNDKLDSLYDFDGDRYTDENGIPYTVVFVHDGDHDAPLCWQKLIKA